MTTTLPKSTAAKPLTPEQQIKALQVQLREANEKAHKMQTPDAVHRASLAAWRRPVHPPQVSTYGRTGRNVRRKTCHTVKRQVAG